MLLKIHGRLSRKSSRGCRPAKRNAFKLELGPIELGFLKREKVRVYFSNETLSLGNFSNWVRFENDDLCALVRETRKIFTFKEREREREREKERERGHRCSRAQHSLKCRHFTRESGCIRACILRFRLEAPSPSSHCQTADFSLNFCF